MPEQEDKQTEHDASTSRHMTFLIMFVYRHDMNEEPLGHMHDILAFSSGTAHVAERRHGCR